MSEILKGLPTLDQSSQQLDQSTGAMPVPSALKTWLTLSFFVAKVSAMAPPLQKKSTIAGVSLDAAGLVALADLTTIAQRTVITGSATFLDILFLAPGIHRQQAASEANGGELPATAALTTGYVFRVENQATVTFLQKIGKTGYLVNVKVSPDPASKKGVSRSFRIKSFFTSPSPSASALYLIGPFLTLVALLFLVLLQDWWGLGILGMLMIARLCNIVVIRRRHGRPGWKGATEDGVEGDLLVLLSQDRWIRIRGQVDDLKAVTAGQWLQDMTAIEGFIAAASTLLIYVVAALAGNASGTGSLIVLCLLLVSAAVLGLSNKMARKLRMHGRIVEVDGAPVSYKRRLDLVKQLVGESGRDDWAISLGMMVPPPGMAQKIIL